MAKKKYVGADESVAAALWCLKLTAQRHTGDLVKLVEQAPQYESFDLARRRLIESIVTNDAGEFERDLGATIQRLPRAARARDGSAVAAAWVELEDTNAVHADLVAVARMGLRQAQHCSQRAMPIVRLLELTLRQLEDAPRPPADASGGLQLISETKTAEGQVLQGVPTSPMERWVAVVVVGQLGLINGKEEMQLATEIMFGARPDLDDLDNRILRRLASGPASLGELATLISRSRPATAKRLGRLTRMHPPRLRRLRRGMYELAK